jgi:hypothetical protein
MRNIDEEEVAAHARRAAEVAEHWVQNLSGFPTAVRASAAIQLLALLPIAERRKAIQRAALALRNAEQPVQQQQPVRRIFEE